MTDIHPTAAAGFSAAADVYERARPGYPEEAVIWLTERLGIGPGRDVLDLAAGTGKLTRQLVPLGARIVAVEPLDEMRAELEKAVPGVEALSGTAEAIPLPNGSVDAVTCAQAFHWFQADEALHEVHRVLRPAGSVALLWNVRDEDDLLQVRIDEILEPHRIEFPGGSLDWPEALDRSRLFGPVDHMTWPYERELTASSIVDGVSTTSFVAAMPAERRAALLAEVLEAIPGEGDPITFRYVTDVFAADRAP